MPEDSTLDDVTWTAATGAEIEYVVVYEDVKWPRDTRGRFRKRYIKYIDLWETP